MKLKLTYTQFKALHDLLQAIVLPARPTDIKGRLFRSLLLSIFKKFYVKMLEQKKKYTVNLSEEQACSWWLFFSEYYNVETPYEKALVQRINNSIHQKFTL